MNAISPVIHQVLAAQKDALNFRVQMALEAKRLEIARLKGDAITELLQATDRPARQAGKGLLFNSAG